MWPKKGEIKVERSSDTLERNEEKKRKFKSIAFRATWKREMAEFLASSSTAGWNADAMIRWVNRRAPGMTGEVNLGGTKWGADRGNESEGKKESFFFLLWNTVQSLFWFSFLWFSFDFPVSFSLSIYSMGNCLSLSLSLVPSWLMVIASGRGEKGRTRGQGALPLLPVAPFGFYVIIQHLSLSISDLLLSLYTHAECRRKLDSLCRILLHLHGPVSSY